MIFYLSNSGNDTGAGTISAPYKTWDKAISVLKPGDELAIRDGVYKSPKGTGTTNRFSISNKKGTATQPIKISSFPGEKVVFDLSDKLVNDAVGLHLNACSYVHIKGIRITGLKQAGGVPVGMMLYASDYNLIDLVEIDNIGGYGFYLQEGSDNNLIKNTDVHDCGDASGGAANGFNTTGGDLSKNNTFEGCRSWRISDDGFDFYSVDGPVTMKNCWSFWNGYKLVNGKNTPIQSSEDVGNGFKLGPNEGVFEDGVFVQPMIQRILNNCMAFENLKNGIDQNSNNDNAVRVQMINVTSYKNGGNDYFFGANNKVIQDVQKCIGGKVYGDDIQKPNNSWSTGEVVDSDFVSVVSTGVDGPRGSNGELPVLDFLRVKSTSKFAGWGYQYAPQPPVTPPAKKHLFSLKIYDDGSTEKI